MNGEFLVNVLLQASAFSLEIEHHAAEARTTARRSIIYRVE
jgi:hypothetical protein